MLESLERWRLSLAGVGLSCVGKPVRPLSERHLPVYKPIAAQHVCTVEGRLTDATEAEVWVPGASPL